MKFTIPFIIISLASNIVFGQAFSKENSEFIDNQLSFYLFNVENGLSNNVINSIEQDSIGFIWIGTEEGLNRYDGKEFKKYKKNDGDQLSISNNFINHLNFDSKGELHIITTKGLNIYSPRQDKFSDFNITNTPDASVSCMTYDAAQNTVLGLYGQGVIIVDSNGTISKRYDFDPNNDGSLSSNDVNSLALQDESTLWVGTANEGLNKIDLNSNRITRLPYGSNKVISGAKINTLYTSSNGNIWIGSKGVQVITKYGDTLKLKKSFANQKGLSDDTVLSFEEDDLGQMWIGTRNGGVNVININDFLSRNPNFKVQWYLPKSDGSSVFNRTVSCLKKDSHGNMWIGTSTGLNYVNPSGEPIKILRPTNEKTKSVGHSRISALAQRKDGKIWIGTDGAGLDLYNPKNGNFRYYKHQIRNPKSLTNDYVISLLVDSKNRLWAGTYQGGLNMMRGESGQFKHYLHGEVEEGSDVRVIFEDQKETLWVGTNRGGLFKYLEKEDAFLAINSLGKLDIRGIATDSNGFLWLSTYGDGIIQYNPQNDTATYFNNSNVEGFKTDVFFSILPLKNGDFLLGSLHEGLFRLNPNTRKATNFTETDGLSNNSVVSLVRENDSEIWMGTFKGISHYNENSNKIYNLNNFNNIQNGEFTLGTGLFSSSGFMYMGGNNGLNVFNPKKLFDSNQSYSIAFKSLNILGENATLKSSGNNNFSSVLDTSILFQKSLDLNHNQDIISLEYVAIKYPYTKDVNYAYRINNYNNQWINTNDAGRVDIIKIPNGQYNLQVRAKFGTGDEVTKNLLLNIRPSKWKTNTAYVFYAIVIVLIIMGSMRFYSDRVKLKNMLLFEKKQRQLEYDLNEEKISFFTSFSHELKTPLTLILAPLEDLIADIKGLKQKNSLKLIQKNTNQLLQSINKLLEFRKSNLGLNKLSVQYYNLTDFIEQWISAYYALAKKRDIELSFDAPEQAVFAWVDIEKINIIFNNLLSNAFKYMDDKGKINVTLSYDEDQFEITVRDTGYGIQPSDLEHIFDRYYRSKSMNKKDGIGIGLALAHNLTELHLGTIQVKSKLNKGSAFTVRIPTEKELFINNIATESDSVEDYTQKPALENQLEQEAFPKKISDLDPSQNKELLLLIDDNKEILEYLNSLLKGEYDLIFAYDGKEGVEKAKRYIPDLIVSDVMMPKMNGIELCTELKKSIETTHIPVILLTAKGNDDSVQEGYIHGADSYLVKPFSSQVLQTRIRNLLDGRIKLRDFFLKKGETEPDEKYGKYSTIEQEKSFLAKLESVILDNIENEKLDVWFVSSNMAMSRTSLYRKVKAITGLNINQFITKVKLDKAYILIKSGNYTIAQASYEVGFNNVKYFRKLFKDKYGQLPSELLKQ